MRSIDEIMNDIEAAESDLEACKEAGFSTACAAKDLSELREELNDALAANHKQIINHVCLWAYSSDINEAVVELKKSIADHTKNGYEFLGGVSIAVDNGTFYLMQTLVKKVDA